MYMYIEREEVKKKANSVSFLNYVTDDGIKQMHQ